MTQLGMLHPDVERSAFTGNGGGNNDQCAVDSAQCSRQMSDVATLCLWHRLRMARTDARDAAAMIAGSYCCVECQNTGSHLYVCGEMKVCPDHIAEHRSLLPTIASFDQTPTTKELVRRIRPEIPHIHKCASQTTRSIDVTWI